MWVQIPLFPNIMRQVNEVYIYPNTELKILRNVRLNNDYDHTIDFATESAQQTYFISKAKFTLYNQQYQRKERGWLKVDLNQNDLWDCTYLMYKNTSYKNKWFYAFILSVQYVNDAVSLINYEIDVMQTWAFDYQLEECFVEREHTITDNLFENLVPESLDPGEDYIELEGLRDFPYEYPFNTTGVYVATTANVAGHAPHDGAAVRKNVFSGLSYYFFDVSIPSEATALITLIEDYKNAGQEDNVIQITQAPSFIGSPDKTIDEYGNGKGYASFEIAPNMTGVFGTITQKGQSYTPKNKKVYTYPYYCLNITDKEGSNEIYKLELFDNLHRCNFLVEGTSLGKVTVAIIPKYYRGIYEDRDSGLVFDNFPECTWSGDSYQIWLAQNGPKMNARMKANIADTAGEILRQLPGMLHPGDTLSAMTTRANATSNAIEAFREGAIKILKDKNYMQAAKLSASRLPNSAHGNFSSGIINIQNNQSGVRLAIVSSRLDYIKRIDQYFSVYGYACNEIKIPNKLVRQNWSYVKTNGCEIAPKTSTTAVPVDDANIIKDVYDHGVTFWRNGDNIGNYDDFSNPVIG